MKGSSDNRYIVFLGAPGAGKGTQAAGVAQTLGLGYIATGDMFRQAMEMDTPLALQAKSYLGKGALVPDEITIPMVLENISAPKFKGGVVFDGFPRNLKQAEALDKALAEQGKAINKVVYLKVLEAELLKRLGGRWVCRQCQTPYHAVDSPPKVKGKCDKCGGELYQRPDDTVETIKKRLEVYFAETASLIDYYAKAGKLYEVDGTGGVDEVGERIAVLLKGL
ncbi:MAG: adenylate kinase [Dehalococcoidales bacterium]|nr:adenylate kinase [Dehalococcoidales bacterium]MDZ4231034.1 adenylate kinase [Dehalococcoidales bacterium]